MIYKKTAFTLVELIVVISIIAILWTISFISIQNYSKESRNSVRVTDLWIMKQWLSVYNINAWRYPLPSSYTWVTYKMWLLWNQWTFWNTTLNNLWSITELPLDPFFMNEYDYSVLWNKNKYQLWTVLEWDFFSTTNFVSQVNAISIDQITPYISWDYKSNDVTAKYLWSCYTLTSPSLFVNNSSSTWSLFLWWSYNFIYNDNTNITDRYDKYITWTSTWSQFNISEVLNKCSISNIDELHFYISKLALAYQQLNWDKNFEEVIYDFATNW